uniref:calcium-independent phospholipase A2-gamma-like isoform X1 n=1 Tax=Myxine glutinosa TaxID=7769 RepID=UPI00358F86A8
MKQLGGQKTHPVTVLASGTQGKCGDYFTRLKAAVIALTGSPVFGTSSWRGNLLSNVIVTSVSLWRKFLFKAGLAPVSTHHVLLVSSNPPISTSILGSTRFFIHEKSVQWTTSTSGSNYLLKESKRLRSDNGNSDKVKEVKTGLFHISSTTTNFGETYHQLAKHINSYFWKHKGAVVPAAEKPANEGVVSDGELKALRSHFSTGEFSKFRSGSKLHEKESVVGIPVVQALVDLQGRQFAKKSLAVLSPGQSLRDALGYWTSRIKKSTLEKPQVSQNETECTVGKVNKPGPEKQLPDSAGSLSLSIIAEIPAEKALEEKVRKIRQQHAKVIARASVDGRTRALVQALQRARRSDTQMARAEELCDHLLNFNEAASVAVKEGAVHCLLRLRTLGPAAVSSVAREALALLGYADPVRGRGICVLSIDGGGTKGIVALETLRVLTELTGKRVHEMFDFICGVSTGAILAVMLGVFRIPLEDCNELYRQLGSEIFTRNYLLGTMQMGWRHSFYDSHEWEAILREKMGENLMIEIARDPACPKVAAVSALVSHGTPIKAYVFRSYGLAPGSPSHHPGGCENKLWQALRASSAAPGYFQEFRLGDHLHQDGGIVLNNPCALALHESRLLWPDASLQCVVSLGTGRTLRPSGPLLTHTNLRTKLSHILSSATDTEEVHTTLDGLLPHGSYFRLNPFVSDDLSLDENRPERLLQLREDALMYLHRNRPKLQRAAHCLTQPRSTYSHIADRIRLAVACTEVRIPPSSFWHKF